MNNKFFRLGLAVSGLAVVFFLAAAPKSSGKEVTFTKDIAPILFKNCAECHRPGDGNHEVKASKTMSEDVQIVSFMPHMHVRGKAFRYTAVYPDGRSEILLNVPSYDFNWQLTYEPKEPIRLPKGTQIDCVAYFDNSAKNKYNPDPTATVRWGDQTWEEMMIGWFTYTKADPGKAPKAGVASGSATGQ